MAAIPAAPADRQEAEFSTVMPPMASTGMETEWQTAARASIP